MLVAARILHGFFYIAGIAAARSLVWFVGLARVVALLLQAAMKAGAMWLKNIVIRSREAPQFTG